MEITARLTADAIISNVKNDRQVVNFTVAINDSYKPKGSTEITKLVLYVQCAYWVNPAIAKYLTKGMLVELQGQAGVNAYTSKEGEPRAVLTFHVNTIKLHGSSKQPAAPTSKEPAPKFENATAVQDENDDLPF